MTKIDFGNSIIFFYPGGKLRVRKRRICGANGNTRGTVIHLTGLLLHHELHGATRTVEFLTRVFQACDPPDKLWVRAGNPNEHTGLFRGLCDDARDGL